jgi:hypothetical protein
MAEDAAPPMEFPEKPIDRITRPLQKFLHV